MIDCIDDTSEKGRFSYVARGWGGENKRNQPEIQQATLGDDAFGEGCTNCP